MPIGFILVIILVMILMAAGLFGIIVPIFLDLPLIWLAFLVYGFYSGFEKITVSLIIIFAGLTILAFVIDYVANIYGVKKMGGSKWGIIGAIIGLMVGFSLGVLGIIFGPMIGAILLEFISGRKKKEAIKAGIGSFLGFLTGVLIKFIIASIMIGIFIWKLI